MLSPSVVAVRCHPTLSNLVVQPVSRSRSLYEPRLEVWDPGMVNVTISQDLTHISDPNQPNKLYCLTSEKHGSLL